MAHFRFYRLVSNRIVLGEDAECASDAAAHAVAERMLRESDPSFCEGIEIWQGSRKVARLDRGRGR